MSSAALLKDLEELFASSEQRVLAAFSVSCTICNQKPRRLPQGEKALGLQPAVSAVPTGCKM